jgi:hypothetical protein
MATPLVTRDGRIDRNSTVLSYTRVLNPLKDELFRRGYTNEDPAKDTVKIFIPWEGIRRKWVY